jgi:hypothetical protein
MVKNNNNTNKKEGEIMVRRETRKVKYYLYSVNGVVG